MDDIQLAMYVDRRLPPGERDRVEAHLAECDGCRAEAVAVRGLVRRQRRRLGLVAGSALAAAAVLLMVVTPSVRNTSSPAPLRSSGEEILVAYGPVGEAGTQPLRFVWSAAPGAMTYRLTLSDARGAVLWSATAADTSATLPGSIALQSSRSYLWVADALLADGTTRSTGLREFRIVP